DAFQPLAAVLIDVMDVIDDEEMKLPGVGPRRAERAGPQTRRQQAARAQAEHLTSSQRKSIPHRILLGKPGTAAPREYPYHSLPRRDDWGAEWDTPPS